MTEMKEFVGNLKSMYGDVIEIKSGIGKMEDAIAEIQRKGVHVALGDGPTPEERKAAMEGLRKYMADGVKTSTINDGPSGGYLAPTFLVREVWDRMIDFLDFRKYATVMTISEGAVTQIPVDKSPVSGGWVGETELRKEDATRFGLTNIGLNNVYTLVPVSRNLLNSAWVDFEQNVVQGGLENLRALESYAIFDGDGHQKPLGIFADESVKTVKTANAGKIGLNDLFDLKAELPSKARDEAVFLMDYKTMTAIRKLKDADGQYLWQPSLQAGMPPTFDGTPVIEAPRDETSKSFTKRKVAVGRAKDYVIAQYEGIEIIRDDVTRKNTGIVEFLVEKRVGGAIVRPDAFAVLEVR